MPSHNPLISAPVPIISFDLSQPRPNAQQSTRNLIKHIKMHYDKDALDMIDRLITSILCDSQTAGYLQFNRLIDLIGGPLFAIPCSDIFINLNDETSFRYNASYAPLHYCFVQLTNPELKLEQALGKELTCELFNSRIAILKSLTDGQIPRKPHTKVPSNRRWETNVDANQQALERVLNDSNKGQTSVSLPKRLPTHSLSLRTRRRANAREATHALLMQIANQHSIETLHAIDIHIAQILCDSLSPHHDIFSKLFINEPIGISRAIAESDLFINLNDDMKRNRLANHQGFCLGELNKLEHPQKELNNVLGSAAAIALLIKRKDVLVTLICTDIRWQSNFDANEKSLEMLINGTAQTTSFTRAKSPTSSHNETAMTSVQHSSTPVPSLQNLSCLLATLNTAIEASPKNNSESSIALKPTSLHPTLPPLTLPNATSAIDSNVQKVWRTQVLKWRNLKSF